MKINFLTVLDRTKAVIARLTKRRKETLSVEDKLKDFFTDTGLFKLSDTINKAFADVKATTTQQEVVKCEQINDLILIVWDKIDASLKEDTGLREIMASSDLRAVIDFEMNMSLAYKRGNY